MALHFTISRKLAALSAVGLAFVVAVGATGYAAAVSLIAAGAQVVEDGTALRHQMRADQAHDALRADVLAALELGMRYEPERQKAIRDELAAHSDTVHTALQQLELMNLDAAERAALDKVRPGLEQYLAQATDLVSLAFTDLPAATAKVPGFTASFQAVQKDMDALSEQIAHGARTTQEDSARTARIAQLAIAGVAAAAVLALGLASLLIGRSIVRPMRRAVAVAETVATGDLRSRIEVHGSDEAAQLLQALARMNGSLVDLVGMVRQASDGVAAGSLQIATGNQDLSQRTEEQASNLQQTAASMEQISATVRANADSTRQASAMAATASASAALSGEAVRKLVDSMAAITEASRRMTDIIGVIDTIAFQTNILALNAAVEAARAGEQGRGFAVVASEVRALAQRSASAARDIKALIASSVAQVRAGQQQAEDAGTRMDQVVRQVQQVTELLTGISSATLEQNKGIAEVSQAVTRIDQVTQGNASLVEEAAAAADSLNRQAERLVQAVSLFRVDSGTALVPA